MNKRQPIWRKRELEGESLWSQYSLSLISLDYVDDTSTINYKIRVKVSVFPDVTTNSKTWSNPYI